VKVGGVQGSNYVARIDEDLDKMIDKNFELQEEERQLRKEIKKLQGKK
jgi:microcompartment protein CcmL/EutN